MVCKWSICTFHIKLVHTKTMPVRCRQTRWQSNMDRGCKEAEHLHSVNIYRVPWKPYTYYITICPQSEQAHIAKPNSKDTTCRSYFKPLNPPPPPPPCPSNFHHKCFIKSHEHLLMMLLLMLLFQCMQLTHKTTFPFFIHHDNYAFYHLHIPSLNPVHGLNAPTHLNCLFT
jgi:hypothetical protein